LTTQHPTTHQHNTAAGPQPRARRGPGRLVDLATVQGHWLNLDPADHLLSDRELIDRLWLVATDVPVLLAEIERSQRLLRIARRRLADLLAATRAALAAAADGDSEPLSFLLDELDTRDPLRGDGR
jgi:hypothetical protein